MGKKTLGKIRCYRSDGTYMGEKSLVEWADELGITYRTAWNAHDREGWTKGFGGQWYKFVTVTEDEEGGQKTNALPLTEVAAIAKAERKSYGQLVAELQREEIKMGTAETEKAATAISLRKFANMVDGECTMHIYGQTEDGPVWLLSVPAESQVIAEVEIGNWSVEYFELREEQKSMNVYVAEERKA